MWLILIFVLAGLGIVFVMISDARLRFMQFSRVLEDSGDASPATHAGDHECEEQDELVS